MVRVLRPGGKFVLIDMEAADEGLRNTEDKIETMRDPSHVKNMSMNEMLNLFAMHNLSVENAKNRNEAKAEKLALTYKNAGAYTN